MLRLSVHYYAVCGEQSYKDSMMRATRGALDACDARGEAVSLEFVLAFICLIVHLEWEKDEGMAPDVLHRLLTCTQNTCT